jgi:hypothetical protein
VRKNGGKRQDGGGSVRDGWDWVQSNRAAGATFGADNQFGDKWGAEIGGADTTEDLLTRIAAPMIQGQKNERVRSSF